ncbi:hypothetical protein BC835DRAFT_1341527 [Cytidiella melzeri]|nr:hypothetical protein BC835DRAFT_1341527 [Cytidiella melzeri]
MTDGLHTGATLRTNTSFASRLPLELLDAILRCVQDEDKSRLQLAPLVNRRSLPLDLTTCRLVSRRWASIATPRLFVRMVVSKGGGKTFEGFLNFLITSPTAAFQIKSLKLTVWTPCEIEAALSAKTLKAMLPYLPRLDELQLEGIKLLPAPDIRRRKNSMKAFRAYLVRLHSPSFSPFLRHRVLPTTRSTIFTLRKLSLRKVRMRQDCIDQLITILSSFSSIDFLNFEEVYISDSFGSRAPAGDFYPNTILRTNHLLFKELHIRETSIDHILPLLEKSASFRKFSSLKMKLDLYHDAPRLGWLLSQPTNPGVNLTELTFDLNGIAWKRSALSITEQSNHITSFPTYVVLTFVHSQGMAPS